ncbi:MAG: dehypoxanthine futalosine cyclase, partial [Deltaproteobacteria bacterium]|nr:dehypoxanthine futalosine cyclase [Deltaproteobacteria bacterium]
MNKSALFKKVSDAGRISADEALQLLREENLLTIGQLAGTRLTRFHDPGFATFQIDRNINYTNICESKCRFCAFYRRKEDTDAYVLSESAILEKVADAAGHGATQIMLQGGLNPDLSLDYIIGVVKAIKAAFPVFVHSFSPPEINHFARLSGLSIEEVLDRLKTAGLDSLPGAGAEILTDSVRRIISPEKISAGRWLEIMEAAHGAGLQTTATMMMGSVESVEDRIEHLQKIRDLQDRTSGFRAFIPWTFSSANTELGGQETSSLDYLRTLAVARIFLDNIANIQGSWVTQGKEIGQISLHFGANDLGSIMLEENVVKAAGTTNRITENEMADLIRRAGKTPQQR